MLFIGFIIRYSAHARIGRGLLEKIGILLIFTGLMVVVLGVKGCIDGRVKYADLDQITKEEARQWQRR